MKITLRAVYRIARSKGLNSATLPEYPGKLFWFADKQYKRISPQKGLPPEEAIEWLMKR